MTATIARPRPDWLSRLRSVMVLRPGQRVAHVPGIGVQTSRRAVASVPWYLAGGAVPIWAYLPKGATTYEASRINLANPGTYDLSNGPAYPTWDATGWTFNRALAQYLVIGDTGVRLKPVTVLIRMTRGGSSFRGILGGSVNNCFAMLLWNSSALKVQSQYIQDIYTTVDAVSQGDTVIAFSFSATGEYVYYVNGVTIASGTNNVSVVQKTNRIGYSPDGTFTGLMAALSCYTSVLTPTQVGLNSTAMAAL